MRVTTVLLGFCLTNFTAFAMAQEGQFEFHPPSEVWAQSPNIAQESWIVRGQSEGDGQSGGGDLAAKSQNPISDLVSLPLQNNYDFGLTSENRYRYMGNLQPVVPVKLNENWNLINRVIVPFVNLPVAPEMREHGIGDMIAQFFISPRGNQPIIWGVGPSVIFPTASQPTLGFQEWAPGINAVVLFSQSPIVAGALITQHWSEKAATQPFFLQPFFNYNLPQGWFVSLSGEAIADWQQPEDRRWNILGGPGVGRVFPIFGQPINASVRFAPYFEQPPDGPEWQFRFQVNFLFPK